MDMSIDKAIAELELLKKNTFSYMPAHQAFITAIDTMRKYQKIQNIVENYDKGILEENDGVYAFKQIREVLEDGNDT